MIHHNIIIWNLIILLYSFSDYSRFNIFSRFNGLSRFNGFIITFGKVIFFMIPQIIHLLILLTHSV